MARYISRSDRRLTKVDLRSLVWRIISLMPGQLAIIKSGATLTPAFRNRLTVRFLSALAGRCKGLPADLDTNLGIDRRLNVKISSSNSSLLFGSPRLLVGERSSLELALALFRHSGCFLDIGANNGLYVFYLCSHDISQKPIYFFEPDPDLYSRLASNVAGNKLKRVRGFQIALSDGIGKATFLRDRTDDSCGSLIGGGSSPHVVEPIEIDTVSFESFVKEHSLENVCAKVDVEGAEELFFDGAKSSASKLRYLIIEILEPAVRRKLPSRIITDGQLQAYYINNYHLEHSLSGEFTYVAPFYNWLFCREAPQDLRAALVGTKFRVVNKPG
jgi:FkbM family methyltransferase